LDVTYLVDNLSLPVSVTLAENASLLLVTQETKEVLAFSKSPDGSFSAGPLLYHQIVPTPPPGPDLTTLVVRIVVGAAGTLLTQLMAKAMNRPITNILFTPITGEVQAGGAAMQGSMKEASAMDVAAMMRYAQKVFIVPGYGMAVAQAQHKVWELAELLEKAGVEVKFAIHPVAGRMPGHMNVLLAEAGVPYDKIFDLEEINAEFDQCDVALVIGANDVVNPVARTDKSSPIYGMPILNADRAHNVICNKRGKGAGYSGIENALFYGENTRMLYGSAQQAINEVIQNIKTLID
jgi:NAD(P) transhydrogenase subunit beta